jgi:hypothetical protein
VADPRAERPASTDERFDAPAEAKRFVHAIRNALFAAQLDLHTLRKAAGDGTLPQDALDELIGDCERHVARAESELNKFIDTVLSKRRED